MRIVWAILLTILTSALLSQPAQAGKRVALVIGNSNYQNVAHLANPANDASALAATFKKASFDVVTLRNDLGAQELRRALREFGDKARDADIAVIYYAGHGLEVDGINYLIPVDAVLERDSDVYDEAIPLDRVLVAVEPAHQLRLIILDACRDNPFAKSMKRTIAQRAIGQGLAKVEPDRPNTLIAFAARAGSTASDGDKNSPFATALSAHLAAPGLDLRKAFGYVRDDVLKATNNRQEPFIYGSLGGDDMMLVPAPVVAAPPPAAADPNEPVRRDYELAERVGTKEAWDFFLATYPKGFYSKLAQLQRDKLAAEEKARATAEEQARLAAEGAKAAEQAKAAADAKAAEDARLAAEKNKLEEEAKVTEAQRAKAAAQVKAAEEAKLAAEKTKKAEEDKAARERAAAEKAASQARAAEDARLAAERATQERIAKAQAEAEAAAAKAKAAEEARAAQEARAAELQKALEAAKAAEAEQRAKAAAEAKALAEAKSQEKSQEKSEDKSQDGKSSDNKALIVAALPPSDKLGDGKPSADDIPRFLQSELRRVGCFTGSIDGSWNEAAQRSLSLFNKSAGTTLDTKEASLDTLEVVRGKAARVCPLMCDHGYKANGDTCVRIECKAGYEIDGDDNCVPKKANREKDKPAEAKRTVKPDDGSQAAPREAALPTGKPVQPGAGELGRCGATSCSAAMAGCIRKNQITGGNSGKCVEKYHYCMQTGEFNGRFCQHSGLARN